VGGIFGKPAAYRRLHAHAPETVLASGLAERGIDLVTVGHGEFVPDDAFDVIHVHHIGRAAYLMAVSDTRAPFVFTGHDGQMLCGFERSRVRREAFRFVLERSDAAVALSTDEARFLRQLGQSHVTVIPNGIATTYADATLHAERHGILYVGQLVALKGVDVLLRAVSLMTRHVEVPVVLAYQNAQLEQPLQALAEELGIVSRVRFAGPQAPDQLIHLYASAQLLVLPSHAESLPSVVTEALQAGTPVVATRVGGIPDQLQEFGTLVDPGDAAALARALEGALDRPPDEARRKAMREYARARFGTAAMAERHAALYRAVAAAGRRWKGRGREPLAAPLRVAIGIYWARPGARRRG
jgi:glycosyltransferase involved in cell wall biosynthesis